MTINQSCVGVKVLHIHQCGVYLSAVSSVLTTEDAAVQTTHQATNSAAEHDSNNIPADAAVTGISGIDA